MNPTTPHRTRPWDLTFRLAIRATLLLGLSACGGGGTPFTGKFSELKPIFAQSCNFSSCHRTASPGSGNMSLSGTDAYCVLFGASQGATFRSTAAATLPHRVVAGDRQKSYLYRKLTLTDAEAGLTTALGKRMPDTGMMLDAGEIEGFGMWIDAGAKDDTMAAACNN